MGEAHRVIVRVGLALAALGAGGSASALIVGRDAEGEAAKLEKEGRFREVAARVYLLITAPFFEREGGRAKDDASRRRWQAEALKALKLAHESFLKAADDYQRAAAAPRAGAVTPDFCRRKAAEVHEQAEAVAALLKAREQP